MLISLIISTYNQPEYLDLSLQSVCQQQGINFTELEVIIADDGSTTATHNIINAFSLKSPCDVQHIWHADNGFQKAMILNKAVAAASGEYLLFVDGDCVLPPDYIAQHLLLREKGCFVAGNRVLLSHSFSHQLLTQRSIKFTSWSACAWLWARLSGKTNKWSHFLRTNPHASWRKARAHNWRFPKGCNLALSKDDYLKVNGYDEAFSGWGHEDADFFVRLLHAGVLIKDGRFAVPVFHLWHRWNDRSNEAENLNRLLQRVNQPQLTQAERGINQYLDQT